MSLHRTSPPPPRSAVSDYRLGTEGNRHHDRMGYLEEGFRALGAVDREVPGSVPVQPAGFGARGGLPDCGDEGKEDPGRPGGEARARHRSPFPARSGAAPPRHQPAHQQGDRPGGPGRGARAARLTMDVTPYLDPKIAPKAVFDSLPARASRVRFMVPTADGDWRAVTWGAFARGIRRLALFLAGDLKGGERAAIYAANRVEWMTAAMAIQSAGGVMVPVYPASTASQAAYVVAHSDAKVLFVEVAPLLSRVFEAWGEYSALSRIVLLDDGLDAAAVLEGLRASGKPAPSFGEVERRLVTFSRALGLGAARDREEPGAFQRALDSVSLEQPGLMLYTSGTSGNPKGVPLTHANVAANGRDWLTCNAPLISEGAVDLLWLPMSHIFGLGEACLGNTLGWTTYLADPMTALARLPEVRPDVFMSVPSLWEKIAQAIAPGETPEERRALLARTTGGRLSFCLSGGAGLKPAIKELFHQQGLLVLEGYGLTECSPTLTLN